MTDSLTTTPLDVVDGIAAYRISGKAGFDAVVRQVTSVIEQAVVLSHDRCLIDGRDLVGFASPSIAARHQMVRAWAGAARGRIHCALVVRPELIDHERFGVLAGHNFGLHSEVFATHDDAFAWLKAQASHIPDLDAPVGHRTP
ncbi:MAG: hypothetical protein JWL98_1692 [Xanthomonadaceae bacterium]|nr:hypothetical protein [Xanthomonadaceae bacterium]